MPGRIRISSLLAGALAASFATGCLTRPIQEDVFADGGTQVFLRSDKRWTTTVEKDYDHPATISDVRLAHILSRIDLREEVSKGNQRRAAIPTESLYTIAEGVSAALSKANPDQEVVVLSIRRHKRFGIFDRKYLTSFLAYVQADALHLHLSRSEWEVPPRRDERLPQPRIGDHPEDFRIHPGRAMSIVDSQSVAIDWRDPIYRQPSRTKITATGEVVRKTILLESPEEGEGEGGSSTSDGLPEGLSPDQYRQLADLEEKRRAGRVTEGEYRARRTRIVEVDR